MFPGYVHISTKHYVGLYLVRTHNIAVYNLHDLGSVSWVGSALHASCTRSHNGLVSTVDDLQLDRGLRRVIVCAKNGIREAGRGLSLIHI